MFVEEPYRPVSSRAEMALYGDRRKAFLTEADMTLYGQRRKGFLPERLALPADPNPPGWVHPKPFPARTLELGPHQGFRRRADSTPGTAPAFPPHSPAAHRAVPGRPIARIGPDGRVTLIYPADPLHGRLQTRINPAVRDGISHHWSIPNVGRRALHLPPSRLYQRAGRLATRERQQVSSFVARKPVHSTRGDRRLTAAEQGGEKTEKIAIPTG